MNYLLIWLFSLFPLIIALIDPNISSIDHFVVDNSSLSVTSFQFNSNSNPSEWVNRIFGTKSIYYDKRNPYHILSEKPLADTEIEERFSAVQKVFKLPSSAEFPICSMEILAYGLIDVSHPLSKSARLQGPSIGPALLRLLKISKSVNCYYRGLYENWRRDSTLTNAIYWPIAIYCPITNITICKRVREHQGPNHAQLTPLKLVVSLESVKWTAQFRGRLNSKNRPELVPTTIYMPPEVKRAVESSYTSSMTPRIGVCLAIPYTSFDKDKQIANSAILVDWVRYYSKLNFLIMIYDRDGANYDSIYNNPRHILSQRVKESNLVYHNYTINGLLNPSDKGMQYDNSELTYIQQTQTAGNKDEIRMRKLRFENQGHDKTLTLTHCRFEAKAVFGIDNVLAVDFDEFLYCPQGGPNPTSQAKYINDYLQHHRDLHIDQISIPQRFIANRTSSTRACVMEKVRKNQSMFSCFAPYFYYMGGHGIKSFHLGHKCPLTGYHQSCPTEGTPRAYDCVCVNKNLRHILPWRKTADSNEGRECGIMHLSLNDNNYVKFVYDADALAAAEPNEIGRIIHSSDPVDY